MNIMYFPSSCVRLIIRLIDSLDHYDPFVSEKPPRIPRCLGLSSRVLNGIPKKLYMTTSGEYMVMIMMMMNSFFNRFFLFKKCRRHHHHHRTHIKTYKKSNKLTVSNSQLSPREQIQKSTSKGCEERKNFSKK